MTNIQNSNPQDSPEEEQAGVASAMADDAASTEEVVIEAEGDSFTEQLLKAAIKLYEINFNKANDKYEIKFILTITIHKVATPDGNKDIAYLRLDKHTKMKEDQDWIPFLFHQEMYVFSGMKERLNPDSPWKERLYSMCLARLVSAGLEYGEFLRRTRQIQDSEKKTEEERLAQMNLVKAEQMPKPLTEDELKYKEWLEAERAKEGL